MLKTIITLIKVIAALIILSVVAYIIIDNQVTAKANDFCDKEVVIGKSPDDLMAKAKKAGAKPFRSSPELLRVLFTGSARPVLCNVTITKGVVTAKQVETVD